MELIYNLYDTSVNKMFHENLDNWWIIRRFAAVHRLCMLEVSSNIYDLSYF